MHFDLKGVKEIIGEPMPTHILPNGDEIPYISVGIFSTNMDNNKSKLMQAFYDSIPDCDTVIWRSIPSLKYFIECDLTDEDKSFGSSDKVLVPSGELKATIMQLYYRAVFLKDANQVFIKPKYIKYEGQPYNKI